MANMHLLLSEEKAFFEAQSECQRPKHLIFLCAPANILVHIKNCPLFMISVTPQGTDSAQTSTEFRDLRLLQVKMNLTERTQHMWTQLTFALLWRDCSKTNVKEENKFSRINMVIGNESGCRCMLDEMCRNLSKCLMWICAGTNLMWVWGSVCLCVNSKLDVITEKLSNQTTHCLINSYNTRIFPTHSPPLCLKFSKVMWLVLMFSGQSKVLFSRAEGPNPGQTLTGTGHEINHAISGCEPKE